MVKNIRRIVSIICLTLLFVSLVASAYVTIYPGVTFYGTDITVTVSNVHGINVSFFEVGNKYVRLGAMNLSVSSTVKINISQANSNHTLARGTSVLRFNATSNGVITYTFTGNMSNPTYQLYRNGTLLSTHASNSFSWTRTSGTHDFDIRVLSLCIDPPYNGSSDYTINFNTVNLTWTSGNGSDSDLVVMKTSGYPSSPFDGHVYQNSTKTYYNFTVNQTGYFTIWSYNATYHFFSCTGLNIPWGVIKINVFKENNVTIKINNYTVLISNKLGTDSYQKTKANNPTYIDLVDIPIGDDCIIQISKEGYYQRIKTMDITYNIFYNLTFYLAPHPDGGGNPNETDYVQPSTYPTTLQTTSKSVSNPAVDLIINLVCIPKTIVQVQGYNSSLYGHWFVVPENMYGVNGSNVTVDESVLDSNTTLIQVSYYCVSDEKYGYQYLVTVVDQADKAVEDVQVTVSAYINTSNTWDSVYIVNTDSSGQIDLYLIAGSLYKFKFVKTSYVTSYADWIPSENLFTKKFQVSPVSDEYPNATSSSDCISITYGVDGVTAWVNVSNYYALCGDLSNFSIWVYEVNLSTGNTSFFYVYNSSDYHGENISFTINVSNNYFVSVYVNHSLFASYWTSFYIVPSHPSGKPTSKSEFDDLFNKVFGKPNSLAWSTIFGLFVFIVCLFAFDQRNAGVGLIITGFLVLGLNAFLGLALLNAMICIFIVVMGVILQWKISRKYS